jgi:hypothetical protein
VFDVRSQALAMAMAMTMTTMMTILKISNQHESWVSAPIAASS